MTFMSSTRLQVGLLLDEAIQRQTDRVFEEGAAEIFWAARDAEIFQLGWLPGAATRRTSEAGTLRALCMRCDVEGRIDEAQ